MNLYGRWIACFSDHEKVEERCNLLQVLWSSLFSPNFFPPSGPRPLLGKRTLIYLPVTPSKEFTRNPTHWDSRTYKVDGNVVTVQVQIPAKVAVGIWRHRLSTKQQGSRHIMSFDVRERIYVLFNAWSKGFLVSPINPNYRVTSLNHQFLFHSG